MRLVEHLAAQVRALPDEKLVEITAPWIAETLASAAGSSATLTVGKTTATATKPRTKRGGAPVAKPRRTSKGVASQREPRATGDVAEIVYAALAASPDAMSVAELAKKTKREATSVGSALQRLKQAGRAFNAGRSVWGRWAILQEVADEAVAALRGGA